MKGKKIALIGSGSIGLYYGARLARAENDVHFLFRSGRQEAATTGIRVSESEGNFSLHPVNHHGTTEEIGPSDLVVIALKATANAALDSLVPPLLTENTVLLTLQNGLGNEEYLADRFGGHRVLGALCFVCLTRGSPASVRQIGQGSISIGEFERTARERTQEIGGAFRDAGVPTKVVDDLALERWRKLVWNIPFNGLAVAEGGITVDKILADPQLHAECRALMMEVIAIARAQGHIIPAEFADFQIERTRPMGAYQPSTLVDFLSGNALEIEPIWGEPLRRAKSSDVSAPRVAALYEKLKALNPR